MALRGRKLENFDELGFLVASGGFDILFSSTSSKKKHKLASTASNRKVTKIQPDISCFNQNIFFSKHQNKAEFKNLEDPEVFRSDFPDLRNHISLIDLISLSSLTGLNSL